MRKFTSHFADAIIERERSRKLQARLDAALEEIKSLTHTLKRTEEDKHNWMTRALRQEFEEKRASGYYTNCPIANPKPPSDGSS